jgi:hypothetical protein
VGPEKGRLHGYNEECKACTSPTSVLSSEVGRLAAVVRLAMFGGRTGACTLGVGWCYEAGCDSVYRACPIGFFLFLIKLMQLSPMTPSAPAARPVSYTLPVSWYSSMDIGATVVRADWIDGWPPENWQLE